MDDNMIIDLFFNREERAICETDGKYGKLLRKLSGNILGSTEDAEECVNDTYLALWNTIPPTRPDPLISYVCKVARNLSLKRYDYNSAAKRNSHYDVALEELEECLTSHRGVEEEISNRELADAIEDFLETLNRENRVIFLRRYWFSDSYDDIAARTGLTVKNVSVRLTRIRKQMRGFLEEREIIL